MNFDRTHLDLRVVDWIQTISVQGSIDSAGPLLRARCSAMDGFHLTQLAQNRLPVPGISRP